MENGRSCFGHPLRSTFERRVHVEQTRRNPFAPISISPSPLSILPSRTLGRRHPSCPSELLEPRSTVATFSPSSTLKPTRVPRFPCRPRPSKLPRRSSLVCAPRDVTVDAAQRFAEVVSSSDTSFEVDVSMGRRLVLRLYSVRLDDTLGTLRKCIDAALAALHVRDDSIAFEFEALYIPLCCGLEKSREGQTDVGKSCIDTCVRRVRRFVERRTFVALMLPKVRGTSVCQQRNLDIASFMETAEGLMALGVDAARIRRRHFHVLELKQLFASISATHTFADTPKQVEHCGARMRWKLAAMEVLAERRRKRLRPFQSARRGNTLFVRPVVHLCLRQSAASLLLHAQNLERVYELVTDGCQTRGDTAASLTEAIVSTPLVLCFRDHLGLSLLHHACIALSPPMISTLCAHGADPLLREKWGRTALHLLLDGRRGQDVRHLAECVRSFFAAVPRSSVSTLLRLRDHRGLSPTHLLARQWDLFWLVQPLLQSHVDIRNEICTFAPHTLWEDAVVRQSLSEVQWLVNAGVAPVDLLRSAIRHRACVKKEGTKSGDIIFWLLNHSSLDFTSRDAWGRGILHDVANTGASELVVPVLSRYLEANASEISVVDNGGATFAHHLLRWWRRPVDFTAPCAFEKILLHPLVASHVPWDSAGNDGNTLLHLAASLGALELLTHGCAAVGNSSSALRRRNALGDSVLGCAIKAHFEAGVAEMLCGRWASLLLNERNSLDRDPLLLTTDVLAAALEEGPNRSNGQRQPRSANERSLLACVDFLLAASQRCGTQAVRSVSGPRGETALHAAVRHNCLDVCQKLLDAGASCYTQGACGDTPLTVAFSNLQDASAASLLLSTREVQSELRAALVECTRCAGAAALDVCFMEAALLQPLASQLSLELGSELLCLSAATANVTLVERLVTLGASEGKTAENEVVLHTLLRGCAKSKRRCAVPKADLHRVVSVLKDRGFKVSSSTISIAVKVLKDPTLAMLLLQTNSNSQITKIDFLTESLLFDVVDEVTKRPPSETAWKRLFHAAVAAVNFTYVAPSCPLRLALQRGFVDVSLFLFVSGYQRKRSDHLPITSKRNPWSSRTERRLGAWLRRVASEPFLDVFYVAAVSERWDFLEALEAVFYQCPRGPFSSFEALLLNPISCGAERNTTLLSRIAAVGTPSILTWLLQRCRCVPSTWLRHAACAAALHGHLDGVVALLPRVNYALDAYTTHPTILHALALRQPKCQTIFRVWSTLIKGYSGAMTCDVAVGVAQRILSTVSATTTRISDRMLEMLLTEGGAVYHASLTVDLLLSLVRLKFLQTLTQLWSQLSAHSTFTAIWQQLSKGTLEKPQKLLCDVLSLALPSPVLCHVVHIVRNNAKLKNASCSPWWIEILIQSASSSPSDCSHREAAWPTLHLMSLIFPGDICTERDFWCIREGNRSTPLHVATARGRLDVMKTILQFPQATANGRDSLGRTPLHLATRKGFFGAVTLLLCKGASATIRDHRGRDALYFAAATGNKEIFDSLVVSVGGGRADSAVASALTSRTLLFAAINAKHESTLLELLQNLPTRSANFDFSVDENGESLLHLAAFLGWKKTIKQLTFGVNQKRIFKRHAEGLLTCRDCCVPNSPMDLWLQNRGVPRTFFLPYWHRTINYRDIAQHRSRLFQFLGPQWDFVSSAPLPLQLLCRYSSTAKELPVEERAWEFASLGMDDELLSLLHFVVSGAEPLHASDVRSMSTPFSLVAPWCAAPPRRLTAATITGVVLVKENTLHVPSVVSDDTSIEVFPAKRSFSNSTGWRSPSMESFSGDRARRSKVLPFSRYAGFENAFPPRSPTTLNWMSWNGCVQATRRWLEGWSKNRGNRLFPLPTKGLTPMQAAVVGRQAQVVGAMIFAMVDEMEAEAGRSLLELREGRHRLGTFELFANASDIAHVQLLVESSGRKIRARCIWDCLEDEMTMTRRTERLSESDVAALCDAAMPAWDRFSRGRGERQILLSSLERELLPSVEALRRALAAALRAALTPRALSSDAQQCVEKAEAALGKLEVDIDIDGAEHRETAAERLRYKRLFLHHLSGGVLRRHLEGWVSSWSALLGSVMAWWLTRWRQLSLSVAPSKAAATSPKIRFLDCAESLYFSCAASIYIAEDSTLFGFDVGAALESALLLEPLRDTLELRRLASRIRERCEIRVVDVGVAACHDVLAASQEMELSSSRRRGAENVAAGKVLDAAMRRLWACAEALGASRIAQALPRVLAFCETWVSLGGVLNDLGEVSAVPRLTFPRGWRGRGVSSLVISPQIKMELRVVFCESQHSEGGEIYPLRDLFALRRNEGSDSGMFDDGTHAVIFVASQWQSWSMQDMQIYQRNAVDESLQRFLIASDSATPSFNVRGSSTCVSQKKKSVKLIFPVKERFLPPRLPTMEQSALQALCHTAFHLLKLRYGHNFPAKDDTPLDVPFQRIYECSLHPVEMVRSLMAVCLTWRCVGARLLQNEAWCRVTHACIAAWWGDIRAAVTTLRQRRNTWDVPVGIRAVVGQLLCVFPRRVHLRDAWREFLWSPERSYEACASMMGTWEAATRADVLACRHPIVIGIRKIFRRMYDLWLLTVRLTQFCGRIQSVDDLAANGVGRSFLTPANAENV